MFVPTILRGGQLSLYRFLGKPLLSTHCSYRNASKMAELLKGVDIVLNDGSKVKAENHLRGKVVALYFSAGENVLLH